MTSEEDCWNAFVERTHINGADNGVLAGLNFAVKDNISIEGRHFLPAIHCWQPAVQRQQHLV